MVGRLTRREARDDFLSEQILNRRASAADERTTRRLPRDKTV
jgi:hypothetical protein